MIHEVPTPEAMHSLAAELVHKWQEGDLILLHGELGAGKTTFVRGALAELGVTEGVRSPTFNLLQVFETNPPVLHADLYRVKSAFGIGIEDYLETHLCFIEWPENGAYLLDGLPAWNIRITAQSEGRLVQIDPPTH